jgi:benzoyl-CoA reductase/2-hydroxyglutaryl-CoA dehydratase subunit BcrC/BadD/HgdB
MSQSLAFKKLLNGLKSEASEVRGNPVLGWTCTYLPLEILDAAGLSSYRILPETSSERADAYLDPNFCPFIKASLGKVLEGGYSFLSGIVMLNTCDGMRRLYDAWRFYCHPPFSFLLDLPRMITSSSMASFREGLADLIGKIERQFGVTVTKDGLASAIEEANRTRALIRRLFSSQGRGDPPLRHSDILDILAEGWTNQRKIFNKALDHFLAELGTDSSVVSRGPKLMVTGSLLDGSFLIRLIEELGGEVVASDLCIGERFLDRVILGSDPVFSLCKAYLEKAPCARMYDTERRISHLKQELDKTNAEGVIYFVLKFCDPYLYEVPAAEEALRRIGVPMLFIEGEYTGRISGGTRTRVQAFLEILGRDAR